MLCTIWYHAIWYYLYNLKKREKHPWTSVPLVKLQASPYNFTKSNTPPCVLFIFLKLYKWYQIAQSISFVLAESICDECEYK